MYSACLYCSQTLGSNEVIETFPVGRRLAFDAVAGAAGEMAAAEATGVLSGVASQSRI